MATIIILFRGISKVFIPSQLTIYIYCIYIYRICKLFTSANSSVATNIDTFAGISRQSGERYTRCGKIDKQQTHKWRVCVEVTSCGSCAFPQGRLEIDCMRDVKAAGESHTHTWHVSAAIKARCRLIKGETHATSHETNVNSSGAFLQRRRANEPFVRERRRQSKTLEAFISDIGIITDINFPPPACYCDSELFIAFAEGVCARCPEKKFVLLVPSSQFNSSLSFSA